jgi:hypothetical protein
MYLLEVDTIVLEALQAGMGLGQDMAARGAARGRALARGAVDLDGDHRVVAGDAPVAERLAHDLLAAGLGIDVGDVDEGDPGIEDMTHDGVGLRLPEAADLAPHACGTVEGHGAEAEFGKERAGLAEAALAQGRGPSWRARGQATLVAAEP